MKTPMDAPQAMPVNELASPGYGTLPPRAGSIPPSVSRWLRQLSWGVIAAVIASLLLSAFLFVEVIVPGYKRPTNRTYGRRFGYPVLLRRLGKPLPVETTVARERNIARSFLGEGTMASDSVLVPMLPTARITQVFVQPGQRVKKGDLLAELDSRKGKLSVEAAEIAAMNARAELRRVQIGSVMVLNREQPGRDAIDVDALQKQVNILRDKVTMKEKLHEQQLITKESLLADQAMIAEAERALENARLSLRMSSEGKGQSERIADNTMRQAVLEWRDRLEELNEYRIVSPVDGIVDRVFVHVGEYNQTTGSPAFRIAAGLWFEGYFDQMAVGEIADGATAEVHLAARPDLTLAGKVNGVNPIVSYGTGGPEATRPIRPTGTSAPEWPVTFKVRIALPPDAEATLVPGLTGFARVETKRASLAIPEAAMISMSAGSGLVFVVRGNDWEVRRARYGAAFDGWLEIVSGLSRGDKVIVEGQRVLEKGDKIAESTWQPPSGARL